MTPWRWFRERFTPPDAENPEDPEDTRTIDTVARLERVTDRLEAAAARIEAEVAIDRLSDEVAQEQRDQEQP